jgi:putative effector of murein hydrolase
MSSALALIGLTVAVFAGATWLYQKSGRVAVLQPVLIAIMLLSLLLVLTHFSYQTYFEATRPLHILLGPAIVALAVPLYENLRKAGDILVPVLGSGNIELPDRRDPIAREQGQRECFRY